MGERCGEAAAVRGDRDRARPGHAGRDLRGSGAAWAGPRDRAPWPRSPRPTRTCRRRGRAHRQRGRRDVLRGARLRAPRADRRAARRRARPRAPLVAGHAAGWRVVTDDVLSRLVIEGYLLQLNGWAGRRNFWAWTVFQELVDHQPEVAWPMLLELIRLAPDEHLDSIAAGPLEDFIARHGTPCDRRPRSRGRSEPPPPSHARRGVAERDAGFRLGPRRGPRRPNRGLDPERARLAAERDRGGYRVDAAPSCWQHRRGGCRRTIAALAIDAGRPARRPRQWESPVGLDVHLEPGVDGFSEDSPTIMRAVVETISRDRPAGLVAPEWDGVALIASTRLIRELEVLELRSRTPGYRVRLRRMSEGQAEALNDVSTFEEMLETADIDAARGRAPGDA